MCGICGTVTFDGRLDAEAAGAIVEAMMQALAHRGHDELGKVVTASAILGATRLAIRGLQDGAQPMVDAQTGVVAACNGEIDNHRELRSWLADRGRQVPAQTDVAVIPGLYLELGEDFEAGWWARSPSPSGIRPRSGFCSRGTGRGSARCSLRRKGVDWFSLPSWPRWFQENAWG